MSGALDKKMRTLAEKLLKKLGKDGSVERVGAKTYNEDTGQTTVTGGTSIPITFYIDSDKTSKLRANNLIEWHESVILISAKELGLELLELDTLRSSGFITTITRFDSVWSGAEKALYEAVAVV